MATASAPNLIWKDVLHPGTQRDRHGVEFTISPADIRQGKHNVHKMLARGLRIPAVWEHQSSANPVENSDRDAAIANYARHTFGEIKDARIDPAGVLWLAHQVDDAADRKQLAKTKFVSPKLFPSYSDSRGGEYRGTTIAHVAATPTPVQFWQRPFQLSDGDALYLSYTPEGHPVADEKKPDKEKPEGTAGGDLSGLIKALKAHGLNIPESVDDLKTLTIAVQANGGKSAPAAAAEPDLDDMDDVDLSNDTPSAQGDTTAAGGPPMLMSDGRGNSVKFDAKELRVNLVRRAKRLFKTGRIARPAALKLQREIESVQMSDPRAAADPLAAAMKKVEAFETLDAGNSWSPSGPKELSATRPAAPPKRPLEGEAEDKEAGEKFLAKLKGRLGPTLKK